VLQNHGYSPAEFITWNYKTIPDEVGIYLHNKQKQCGVADLKFALAL
jgi:hypothetical protein